MGVIGRLNQYGSMLAQEFDDYSMSENLHLYSEDFSNAVWNKSDISVTTNQIASPDGSQTADKITIGTGVTVSHIVTQTSSITARGSTVTFSIFAKYIDWPDIRIQIFGDVTTTDTLQARFNIQTGTVVSSGVGGSAVITNSSVTAFPNGWYRCSATGIVNTTDTSVRTRVAFMDSTGSTIFTGNGVSSFYLWGTQLETGTVPTDYTPTTTTAITRVLSSSTNQRIITNLYTRENLLVYSEQFDQSAFWAVTNSTITANTVASPTGSITADTITDNATSGVHVVGQGNVNVISGVNYTLSCFVKKGTARYARLGLGGISMTFNSCVFDLDTQTFVSGTGTFTSVGNGWYRISSSSSAASTGAATFSVGISNSTNTGYVGVGDTLYIWGAQVESGLVTKEYNVTTNTLINIPVAASTYFSSGFEENTGFTSTLAANVFSPYDPVYDDFAGTLVGPGQGRYMRQTSNKSAIVYNEIDEVSDFRDIVRTGLVLDLDAAQPLSYPGYGTTWNDLSGNGNTGTLTNGPTYSSTNNGSIVFAGDDDFVTCGDPSSLNFGTGNFSLSFVTYTTAYGFQGGSYVGKGDGTSIGFDFRDGAFFVYGTSGLIAQMAFAATLNVWECHTLVFDRSTSPYITYYKNGASFSTSTTNNSGVISSSINTTQPFRIGLSVAGGPTRYFNGNIPIVLAYNRALTAIEALKNFNAVRHRFGI